MAAFDFMRAALLRLGVSLSTPLVKEMLVMFDANGKACSIFTTLSPPASLQVVLPSVLSTAVLPNTPVV
jgi:hypothetical protein